MYEQRKPTDDERENLKWLHDKIGTAERLLDDATHGVAKKVISILEEIHNAAFDPFGGIFSGCEICEQLILDTDEFEDVGDCCWAHRECADRIRKDAPHD